MHPPPQVVVSAPLASLPPSPSHKGAFKQPLRIWPPCSDIHYVSMSLSTRVWSEGGGQGSGRAGHQGPPVPLDGAGAHLGCCPPPHHPLASLPHHSGPVWGQSGKLSLGGDGPPLCGELSCPGPWSRWSPPPSPAWRSWRYCPPPAWGWCWGSTG